MLQHNANHLDYSLQLSITRERHVHSLIEIGDPVAKQVGFYSKPVATVKSTTAGAPATLQDTKRKRLHDGSAQAETEVHGYCVNNTVDQAFNTITITMPGGEEWTFDRTAPSDQPALQSLLTGSVIHIDECGAGNVLLLGIAYWLIIIPSALRHLHDILASNCNVDLRSYFVYGTDEVKMWPAEKMKARPTSTAPSMSIRYILTLTPLQTSV